MGASYHNSFTVLGDTMLKPTGYRDAAGVTYSVFWRHTLCNYAGRNGPGERKSFTLENMMYGKQKRYKKAIGSEEEISFVGIK